MSVNKSISMPLRILNEIMDESELMGKDFSSTLIVLVNMGLNQRRVMEVQAREEREAYAKKQLGDDKK